MTEDTSIQTVPRDRQLANGRWACPICPRDFSTKKIARRHVTTLHEGLRWPCESKHTRYITSSTTVPHRSDGKRKKVLRVEGKSKPWRCPNSCGKRFMKRSGLSRHLREVCMENDNPLLPKACSPEYTPVVSVRLQMKRLLGEKVHDNYDNREISRSNTSGPEEKHVTRNVNLSTPNIRQSDIMPIPLDRTTSTDEMAISSIIVSRDSTTFNIKRILFKDAHDPRQPDYVQLYPSTRDTRGRIRCARAILCNQTTVSDEHAPSDKPSSYEYILPLLFRNLNFSHILDHAQANYGQVSNEELENLRQEGVRRICRYFGRDAPSMPVYTSPSFQNNKSESKNSGVRAGTPLLNTDVSEPEQSGLSAPDLNSSIISISSMTSSRRPRDSLPEDALTRNKKPRLQSKSKTLQVFGVSEVEGITFWAATNP